MNEKLLKSKKIIAIFCILGALAAGLAFAARYVTTILSVLKYYSHANIIYSLTSGSIEFAGIAILLGTVCIVAIIYIVMYNKMKKNIAAGIAPVGLCNLNTLKLKTAAQIIQILAALALMGITIANAIVYILYSIGIFGDVFYGDSILFTVILDMVITYVPYMALVFAWFVVSIVKLLSYSKMKKALQVPAPTAA